MKKIFYLVAASLLMTSCLKDQAIEAYNEEFVRVFGDTDPLHTWKMVDNQSVEVNLDKSSRVKIYVKVDNTYRLAADYENVSGAQSLSFDAPMGCKDIHVTVDGVPYQGINSRNGSQTNESISISKDVFQEFTYGQISTFHNDGETLPEKQDNREKVELGCKLISQGDGWYEFYPVYWGGVFHHGYGLYYYTTNEENKKVIVTVPFFEDHKAGGLIQRINGDGTGDWVDVIDDYAYDYFFPNGPTYADSEVVLKSSGYKFYLPPGTVFGFYVDIAHGTSSLGRFYSDPELNQTKAVSNFAFLHKDDNTQTSYITMEDFDDNDYNDFIFMLVGAHEHLVEKPVQYIYAVEDLGGNNDFDFNDVVFSVSHVSGKENATVQPLAAGGIYEAYIRFGGKSYGEIHNRFGVASNVMVNTASGTTKGTMKKADPFLVPVGVTWSHAAYGNSGNGFSVEVQLPNKPDKVLTTYEPGSNAAPQMLVLSENWLWPTEKKSISDAYPGFGEWGANYTNTTWVNSPNSGSVVHWK